MKDEHIDQRGTVEFRRVERPLVSFKKQPPKQLPAGEELGQKFPLVAAVPVGRDDSGEDLHVGSRNVPAKLPPAPGGERGQTKLAFGEGNRLGPLGQGQSDGAELTFRVDAGAVQAAGTADGEDNRVGAHHTPTAYLAVLHDDTDDAARPVPPLLGGGDQPRYQPGGQDTYFAAVNLRQKGAAHIARSVGTGTGGARTRIVIGLVADVFSAVVLREGDPQLDELEERPCREGRLDQRQPAVGRAPRGVTGGHQRGGIALGTGQAEFVVGLLVASGVDRGPQTDPLGENDRTYSQGVKANRRR